MTTRIGSLAVTPLCLGGNVFGWTADHDASLAILNAFVVGGGNFIDTADVYSAWVPGHSGGESERVIGEWLTGGVDRSKLVIATKVAKHPRYRGLSPHNIRMAVDGSRRRLGLEKIDLYYAHEDDEHVPTEDWLQVFAELIDHNVISQYGLSNFTAARTVEVVQTAARLGLPLPVAQQPAYNLVNRSVEGGLAEVCLEHGLALIPYWGLASGFLTGKYSRDEKPHGARAAGVQRYFTEAGWAVLDVLVDVATANDVEPGTVALAWLRGRPGVAAPIASASSPEQVSALLASVTLKLTAAQRRALDAASAAFAPEV